MVEKSTYLTGRFPEANRSIRAADAAAPRCATGRSSEIDRSDVSRAAQSPGRVLDAHGDPVDFAQVRVLRVPRGGRPTSAGQAQTNDLGEYRVPRLQPGRYLRAGAAADESAVQLSGPVLAESPLPQPLPTYYPNAPVMAQAQPITVNRGETISGVDLMLAEGVPTLVTGTVLRSDGEVVTRRLGEHALHRPGGHRWIRQRRRHGDSSGWPFRLTLAPGEYTLEAQVVTRQGPGPVGPNEQLFGSSADQRRGRVRSRASRSWWAAARPRPAGSCSKARRRRRRAPGRRACLSTIPTVPAAAPAEPTIAADWTFKLEGLSGTCGAQPTSMFGRWTLKAVTFRGQNLMDQLVTFETGQQYTNVQIVVTDKRTQMDLRVSGDDGQPTREYVAIVLSARQGEDGHPQLRQVRTYVPPPMTSTMAGSQR